MMFGSCDEKQYTNTHPMLFQDTNLDSEYMFQCVYSH